MGQLVNELRSWLYGPSGWGQGDRLLSQLFRDPAVGTAGQHVGVESAQSLSTVWACVGLLSSTIAGLPLHVYKRTDEGRERDPYHAVADLLTHAPNRWQTAFAYREAMARCLLLYGNAFSWILRDAGGRPRELVLLHPTAVQILTGGPDGVRYRVTWDAGHQETLDSFEVLHVVGHSFDGVHGLSVISAARRSLGLGMALEEFGAAFFQNGSSIGGLLSHPGNITPESEARLRASLEKRHQGTARAHQFIILQGGMSFSPLTVPNDDAQFLESAKASTATVARWFGVPPSMVNAESAGGSLRYSTAESESQNFVTYALLPWLRRLEAAYNRSLISSLERFQWYCEHLVDGLLRADTTARWSAYEKAIQLRVMSRDEVRARENLEGPAPVEVPRSEVSA
jgi:HK97 family phage portal protein